MDTTKKILLSVGVVALAGAYVLFQYLGKSGAPVVATNPATSTTTDQQTTSTPPPTPTPTPKPTAQYIDGSYTGTVADAFYGPMQVKAIISGGKITDVRFVQQPNAAGETTEVSARSLPVLKREAIAAQSAKVNTVSGATQTSDAFVISLNSALAQAKSFAL